MPRSRFLTGLAVITVVALSSVALSGCVPDPVSDEPQVPELTVAQFEAAGISIVPDASSDDAADGDAADLPVPTAFQLSELQVERLISDASTGGGLVGYELDALAPVTDGAPPVSYLLASWILDGSLAGAQAAATQFVDPDWTYASDEVFPPAVIALFVGDMVSQAAAVPVPQGPSSLGSLDPVIAAPAALVLPDAVAAGGPCTFVTELLHTVIQGTFDALRLIPGAISTVKELGFFGTLLTTLIDGAIDLAQGVVEGLVSSVLAPVFEIMRTAIAALGVATVVLSYFQDQKLEVTASPGTHHAFSVDPAGRNTGAFIAKAVKLAGKWPKELVDCAAAVGAPLPEQLRSGDTAKWNVSAGDGLVEFPSATSKIAGDLTTKGEFQTGHEDAETAKGDEVTQIARVAVEIPRKEVGDFLDLAAKQVEGVRAKILSLVPALLRDQAEALLKATLDPTIASIRKGLEDAAGGILTLKGAGWVFVTFHTPKEPEAEPTSDPDDPGDDEGEFCRQFAVQAGIAADALPGASDPFTWAAAFAVGLHSIEADPPAAIAPEFGVVVGFYDLAGQSSFENAQALADYVAANDVDGSRARLWDFCGVPQLPAE